MRKSILLLFVTITSYCSGQLNVVPLPAEIKMGKGFSTLKEPIAFIVHDKENANNEDGIRAFKTLLSEKYKIKRITDESSHSNGRSTIFHLGQPEGNHLPGYYEIRIESGNIFINGDAQGRFYAFQTLRQMMVLNAQGNPSLPNCSIKDYPRFTYRGMHLDVARHFFPVSFIKKYIDYLAFHKFNTLHWHLTEDQGWRIEIKKYPKLTSIGGYRNGTIKGRYPGDGNDNTPYGGFYTQEQIKDIVQYAAERHITIIPEIELPGHSSAAIAAYPELSCFPAEKTDIPANMISAKSKAAAGKLVQETWGVFEDVFCPTEYTFGFLQDVLDEVTALFPGKYIHIGGDECPKEAWKRSPFCQQLMKEKGIKDEHELQSYFIQRIEKYINSKGRQIIGWDEILEGGLAPNATVMSWRGEEGGIAAARQQHDVIMTPGSHCYLDHSQSQNEDSITIGSYLPLEKVYAYEPVPKVLTPEEARRILGAQGNVWTEYMTNEAKVEYMIFPRMSALAEVLWSPKEKRNWQSFEQRLPVLIDEYQSRGTRYSNAYYDIKSTVMQAPDNKGVWWQLRTAQKNSRIEYDNNSSKSPMVYKQPIQVTFSSKYTATCYDKNNKPLSRLVQQFDLNKATGKTIKLMASPSESYPGNGAFTLVDGIQSQKGFARSAEFLGFNGSDCNAVIDLGKPTTIRKITIHALRQPASWIWRPQTLTVEVSADGIHFTRLGLTDDFETGSQGNGTITIEKDMQKVRFVSVSIANWGEIPAGNPGAGNKPWLFVDEIEIE